MRLRQESSDILQLTAGMGKTQEIYQNQFLNTIQFVVNKQVTQLDIGVERGVEPLV
jgi:hypothetical protein